MPLRCLTINIYSFIITFCSKVDPVREPDTTPVTKGDSLEANSSAAHIPDRPFQAQKSDQVEPRCVSITPATNMDDDSSVFNTVASDQYELDWQNSRKLKSLIVVLLPSSFVIS